MTKKVQDTSWLNDRIRLTQWDIKQPYKQYDLTPIHSLPINNNEKFMQLKSKLSAYNNQVESLGNQKEGIIHGGVKWHFAATLYTMLRDITQTKDTDVQRRYLDDVYQWANNYEFDKRLRPLTATTRPGTSFTRPATGNTITNMRKKLLDIKGQEVPLSEVNDDRQVKDSFDNIMLHHKLSTATQKMPIIHPNNTKQMQNIKDQQKDYKYQHRTSYSEIEVPAQRLKQYPRRKRLDLQFQKPIFTGITKKQQRISTEEILNDNNTPNIQLIDPKQQQVDQGWQQQFGEEGDQQVEIPEIDFGVGQVDEQGDVEEVQQQEIVDKLGPKIKVYKDFELQVHDQTVKVSKNRNFRKKNNELKNIIIDSENTKMIQENWVRAKSRWRNQQSRKSQAAKIIRSVSATMQQNFPENVVNLTHVKNRPATSTRRSFLKSVEEKQRSLHVQNTLKNQLNNIRLNGIQSYSNKQQSNLIKPRCLSAFVPSKATKRVQFSQLLSRGRQIIYNQLDNELSQIKDRLAASRIPIDISKLKSGICLQSEQMKMMYQEDNVFPAISGKLLLHNPYFKVGKKKKKKKKK